MNITFQPMNETNEARALRELFETLARNFISHPDDLEVTTNQNGRHISMSVRAHVADMGKLVGTGAEMFYSLRNVIGLLACRLGVGFHLARFKEQNGTTKDGFEPSFMPDPNWPKSDIEKLFNDTCRLLFKSFLWKMNHGTDEEGTCTELVIPPSENLPMPDNQVQDALSKVFHAVGRSKGRKITITIIRKPTNERKTDERNNPNPALLA